MTHTPVCPKCGASVTSQASHYFPAGRWQSGIWWCEVPPTAQDSSEAQHARRQADLPRLVVALCSLALVLAVVIVASLS
jgi:hypothetical protein